MKYIIVTHTDMDGVAAAALYIYLSREKPVEIIFTEPYTIEKSLNKLRETITRNIVEKIVIEDIGINTSTLPLIKEVLGNMIRHGIIVEWYDHHVWESSWIKELKNLGVKLYVDRTTCATGVVAKYVKPSGPIDDNFVKELVLGVCGGDLWRFDYWRSPWFLRLIRRRDNDNWRLKVIEVLSKGVIWIDEFTENIVSKLEKELKGYNMISGRIVYKDINGTRVAVAPAIECIDSSFIASYIIGRYNADIVGVISPDGKLSLRSRKYNVREIAKALGGGGHKRASGAKIKIPWRVRILRHILNNAIESYTLDTIIKTIQDLSGIDKLDLGKEENR